MLAIVTMPTHAAGPDPSADVGPRELEVTA
jgi:hypothetical protein